MYKAAFTTLVILFLLSGCKKNLKDQEDKIYSRHLQRHVTLRILSTPVPSDKSDFNLLILNDGQDMDQLRIKSIVDSLYDVKKLEPLLIVGIQAGDRMKEFGVSGMPDYEGRGNRADKYAAFIHNELYYFIKKKAGVRKFNSIAIAGNSLGGLSALDIAWDHSDRFDMVGVFSGSFWWRNLDAADSSYSDLNNRIMISKIRSSKKRPHLKYWFYSGNMEETNDRDHDGVIDVTDDTRDLAELIQRKNICPPGDIICKVDQEGKHDYTSWSRQMPAFLLWAFGK